MNFGVSRISLSIISFILLGCLFSFTQTTSEASNTFTLIYAGEEGGQLGLHGCGTEQVGGLSRRQTVIQSLREKHPAPLNLHTGNILDPIDPNNETHLPNRPRSLEYDELRRGLPWTWRPVSSP